MRAPVTFVLCAASVTGIAATHACWALDPPTAAQAATVMTDKARQLYEEGLAAFKKGKFLEAHVSYLAAWSLNKHWQIAANLTDSELELGKFRDAAEHAAYYRKHAPADRQQKADALVKRTLAHVGVLSIDVEPAGAEVLVDDVPVGRAPLTEAILVDPGAHKVTARLAGRPDDSRAVTLSAGSAQKVALKIVAEAPKAPAPVVMPETRPLWPAVVTGVLAAGGLAVGAGLTVAANGKAHDEARLQTGQRSRCSGGGSDVTSSCAALYDAGTSRITLSNGAATSFLVGGAFAAAGAGLAIWAASGRKSLPVGVAPAVGAAEAGLVLRGTW